VRPPEVVLLAPADDPLARDPDLVGPHVHGLVVGLEHGDPQPLGVDPVALSDQLVRVLRRARLEVVAEREVPEHLEQGAVPCGPSHQLDVHGSGRLLHRGRAKERRLDLSQEVRDELVHPGVRQQQPRLRRRDQGRRSDTRVTPLLEEAKEEIADL
jgi:hypothetical protein